MPSDDKIFPPSLALKYLCKLHILLWPNFYSSKIEKNILMKTIHLLHEILCVNKNCPIPFNDNKLTITTTNILENWKKFSLVLQCPEHFAAYHISWKQHDLSPEKVHCFFPSFHFHCLPATSINVSDYREKHPTLLMKHS